jgi:hypothetical protein
LWPTEIELSRSKVNSHYQLEYNSGKGNDTDLAKLDKVIETFTKYAALCSGNSEVGIIRQD